jgi:CRISPR-associated endonuclease Cas2
VHRLAGKRSFFIECADRSSPAQLTFLSGFEGMSPERVSAFAAPAAEAEVIVHPRMKQWANDHPELFRLEQCCPPIGHVIAACRNGSALSMREEKILFHTLGFLPRAKTLVHGLLSAQAEYNPHLVGFDIVDDRVRYRVVKILKEYGYRVQKSVFECSSLNEKQFLKMKHRIEVRIDHAEDSVRYYALCRGCVERVEFSGMGKEPRVGKFRVV